MIGLWPCVAFSIASSIEYQAALSTSGNSAVRPECGGHSIEKALLAATQGQNRPHRRRRRWSCRRAACAGRGRDIRPRSPSPFPLGIHRSAAASQPSPSFTSPLGMDHAPGVLPGPERTARMHKHDFDPCRTSSKEEDAGADLRHSHHRQWLNPLCIPIPDRASRTGRRLRRAHSSRAEA